VLFIATSHALTIYVSPGGTYSKERTYTKLTQMLDPDGYFNVQFLYNSNIGQPQHTYVFTQVLTGNYLPANVTLHVASTVTSTFTARCRYMLKLGSQGFPIFPMMAVDWPVDFDYEIDVAESIFFQVSCNTTKVRADELIVEVNDDATVDDYDFVSHPLPVKRKRNLAARQSPEACDPNIYTCGGCSLAANNQDDICNDMRYFADQSQLTPAPTTATPPGPPPPPGTTAAPPAPPTGSTNSVNSANTAGSTIGSGGTTGSGGGGRRRSARKRQGAPAPTLLRRMRLYSDDEINVESNYDPSFGYIIQPNTVNTQNAGLSRGLTYTPLYA